MFSASDQSNILNLTRVAISEGSGSTAAKLVAEVPATVTGAKARQRMVGSARVLE